jgi:hypothetical protein
MLAKYIPNGGLDPTFGRGGLVDTPFGVLPGAVNALALDGNLLLAAGQANTQNGEVALARYLDSGALDTTFGSQGLVDTNVHSVVGARAVMVQEDEHILAIGQVVGQTTLHLDSVPGVVNDAGSALATYFLCTSTSRSPQVVGVEVFNDIGSLVNDATTTKFTLSADGAVNFGTAGSVSIGVHENLSVGALPAGAAGILSTSKSLIRSAVLADPTSNPPAALAKLTIVAKTKEKGD